MNNPYIKFRKYFFNFTFYLINEFNFRCYIKYLTISRYLTLNCIFNDIVFIFTNKSFYRNSINGGSINFDLAFKKSNFKIKKNKIQFLRNLEKKYKVNELKTLKKFSKDMINLITKIKKELKKIKNKKIYGFGASTNP